ncbi:MAG: condensation domain-containing protein, partial [Holophaga sp.]|nr:condensation domain-containing protein [Holophaga sp.]
MAALELFLPLMVGAQVVLAATEEAHDGALLAALIERNAPSFMQATPATFNMLLTIDWRGNGALQLLCGGEAMTGDLARDLIPCCGRLWNVYGPTEATVWATILPVTASLAQALGTGQTIPIGHPIANTRAYVLDRNGEPALTGVAGELHLGGVQLARGYLNQPGLTTERFIPDPFSNAPGARLYKTGDLVRWLPDGNLEYLGRTDFQVKLRGQRIELGEIEAALRQHPAIREAVVLAREDTPGDMRLVAYLVATEGTGPLEAGDLRHQLSAFLPNYMIPSSFITLEALPLTPSGKLDRRALPSPEYQAPPEVYVAPRTPVETILTGIFAEVLGLDRVGRNDNFFDLGGHSLLATQVVSRVRQTLGIELPLHQLFETPVISDLAARVEAVGAPATLTAISLADRSAPLPLSFAQQRLWFLDQLEGERSSAYLLPFALRLTGSLDHIALRQALQQVVDRHEVLRTSFIVVDGEAFQAIAPVLNLAIPLTDLSTLPAEEPEREALRLAQEDADTGFNLSRGPLIRFTLLRLDEREHILLVNMHHIISDGWSLGLMVNELTAFYTAILEGRPDPLPPLPIQYADFAAWQRQWLSGDRLQRQLDYWRGQLASLPALLTLPTDRPRPAVQSFAGRRLPIYLDPALTGQLQALAQASGATLFMILAAAFAVLLSRHSGQTDLAIGTPTAGRTRQELEGLVGFFVNTLVLRFDLEDDPSFQSLLERVKQTCLDAQAHQDIPFERLVDELKPVRTLAHHPLFQVMVVLQNTPEAALTLPGLRLEPLETDQTAAKFDLTLDLTEAGGGLRGFLEYNTDLFHPATIERMANHFHTLLEAAVTQPEAQVGTFPLMTAAERRQVLVDFNATAADYPRDRCVHQLFEDQVARTPEATAL